MTPESCRSRPPPVGQEATVGYSPKAPGPRERHLLLALLFIFIGVVIFRMAQLVLIVALELLGGFRVLVDLAHGCLILTGMFIVSVIVVILGACPWRIPILSVLARQVQACERSDRRSCSPRPCRSSLSSPT
jgi:hypothetical protein